MPEKQIKKVRNELGLSQEAFAKKCHISFGYLRQVESGKRTPSVSWLKDIAKTLGISAKDLISD